MGRFDGRRSWFQILLPFLALLAPWALSYSSPLHAEVLGEFVDVSQDFQKPESTYFVGSELTDFDPATGLGNLRWDRYRRQANFSADELKSLEKGLTLLDKVLQDLEGDRSTSRR